MTRADVPIGVLLAVACLWVHWQARALQYGTEFAPGPGFAPLWLSLVVLVLAVLVALQGWRTRGVPAEPVETGGRSGLLRVAASLAGMLVMLLLIPALGLLLALLVYLLFLAFGVERLRPVTSVGVSVGTVGFIHLVFARFLGVPLPTGPLGF